MDLSKLSDEELAELQDQAGQELGRRQTAVVFEQKLSAVVQEGREAGVIGPRVQGDAWREPGEHDLYVRDDVVTHNGKTWVSLCTPNPHEPGVKGWEEREPFEVQSFAAMTATMEDVPEYEAPKTEDDAYNTGDRVQWQDQTFEAVKDNVMWSPSYDPEAWKLVTTEGEEQS